jgi:creatinine amidohydrolase/Fe(II)-dependent formamide hydrolase-like protein
MLHPGCNILLSQVAALAVDLRSWKFFPTQPVGSSLQKMLHPGCKMSPNQVLASAIRLDLQSWKFFPTQPVGSSLQKMLHPGCNIFLLVIRHFSTPEEALDAAAFCYLG